MTATSRQVGGAGGIREEGLGTQGQQHTDSLVPRRSFVQAPASEQRSGGLWTRGRRWSRTPPGSALLVMPRGAGVIDAG